MKFSVILSVLVLGLSVVNAQAEGFRAKGTFVQDDKATTVKGGAFNNEQGQGVRRKETSVDSEGNYQRNSGSGYSGQYGQGYRKGQTTVNADGTAQHQGQSEFQGAQGQYFKNQGNFTRNDSGYVEGSGSTSVTNKEGYSYEGHREADGQGNYSYSGTCYDPQGYVIACPRK